MNDCSYINKNPLFQMLSKHPDWIVDELSSDGDTLKYRINKQAEGIFDLENKESIFELMALGLLEEVRVLNGPTGTNRLTVYKLSNILPATFV